MPGGVSACYFMPLAGTRVATPFLLKLKLRLWEKRP